MKRIVVFLLVLALSFSLFAQSASEKSASTVETNTLTVWAWDKNFNIPALLEAERIYQQDHPDFKLNIVENVYTDIEVKLITADQAGDYSTLPDIFLMQDNSAQKMLTNYPGIFTSLDASGIKFDDFAAGKVAVGSSNGKHYGLPFDNGAVIMPIRTDLIAKAGLTVADFTNITWDQFFVNA